MGVFCHLSQAVFWRPSGWVPDLESLPSGKALLASTNVAPRVGAPATSGHPLTVVSLAGGKIIGNLRMVATADDLVVGGLQSLFGCAVPEKHYLLRRHRFRLPRFRRGRALLLGAGSSDNYYHWLLDSLPRWKMLQAAGGGIMTMFCCPTARFIFKTNCWTA